MADMNMASYTIRQLRKIGRWANRCKTRQQRLNSQKAQGQSDRERERGHL